MAWLACISRRSRLYSAKNTELYSAREDLMAEYEPWNKVRADAIIAAHLGEEGAVLPILHGLQAAFGCVPLEAEPVVAAALNISRAEVHGIVTFYHEFRRNPPGRHLLHVCRAEACQSVGAETTGAYLRQTLGVDWHETTANGAVTLEPVFCLGLCASGPAALVDGHPVGRLNPSRIERILETLS
jgi:formate dehydrogenase subunit gamma